MQEGASRALKPVRDLFGWFGDTLDAKDERDQLKAQRDRLLARGRRRAGRAGGERSELRDWSSSTSRAASSDYAHAHRARHRPLADVWYSTLHVDKGFDDGVRVGHPVINDGGLVGRVTEVFGAAPQRHAASPTPRSTSRRRCSTASRATSGLVEPSRRQPDDLLVQLLPRGARVAGRRPRRHRAARASSTARVAVPAGHPDRPRHAGRQRGARSRPAGPHHAVRRPAQPRLRPDPDAARTTARARRCRRRDATATSSRCGSPALGPRRVVVQIAAVSQVPVFGASADLSPLVVAVGRPAAPARCRAPCFGFGVGLFADIALVQTLGVSSLVFARGRLRGRAPARGARPAQALVAARGRRRRDRVVDVGFALMQFLLGVDAPVSWLLLRQIARRRSSLNTLLALPIYALVRRCCSRLAARRPAPAPARAPTRPAACRRSRCAR